MTKNYTAGVPVHNILKGYSGYITRRISLATLEPAAQEVIQCIPVEAGMAVENVYVSIVTASGGTLTATVGDGDSANGYDASTNLNATAGTLTCGVSGTDSYVTTPKLYAAADTIDLTLSNNTPGTTGVFDVTAKYVRIY